jgi:hypothetical protein
MQSFQARASQRGFAAYVVILAVVAVFVSIITILQLNITPAPANLYQAAIFSNTPAAIAFVQQNSKEFSSTSVTKVAYPTAQAAGDLNVVIASWHGTGNSITSVTDTQGNTYALAIGITRGTGLSQSIYYAKNSKAGANTVTLNYQSAVTNPELIVLEYAGADTQNPFLAAQGQAGLAGSAKTASSGAISVPANVLIVGAGVTQNKYVSARAPYTQRVITAPQSRAIAEDWLASTAGTYDAEANLSSTNAYYVMQLAAFLPGIAPTPTPTPTPSSTPIPSPVIPVPPPTPTPTPTPTPSTITIGETNILPLDDNGNGNLLLAQNASLSQTATIQSLSFYVTVAGGNLRLGIYDASGPSGGPGAKRAETASFTPVVGWNTANVITPVSLSAGTYWLAYLPSSNTLAFKKDTTAGVSGKYCSYTYGVMPATFSTAPASTTSHWSLYATLN